MGVVRQSTGQNPDAPGLFTFGTEGDAPGFQVSTDGVMSVATSLTVAGTPITGGGGQQTIRRAYIKTGDVTLPAAVGNPLLAASWVQIGPGFELQLPAAVGDDVALMPLDILFQPGNFIDLAVVVGATNVRFKSSGNGSPTTAGEGDPGLYASPGTFRTSCGPFGFTVGAGDLDAGVVRFQLVTNGAGTGKVFASTNYPFYWEAINRGVSL